jgi:hypothetical protein
VQVDAIDFAPPAGGSDDVDHDGSFIDQPQQGCGAAMRHHCALSAGENSSPQAAALRGVSMFNRVDTTEDPMKPGGGDLSLHHVIVEAKLA